MIAHDKCLHIIYGVAIFVVAHFFLSAWASLGVVLAIGLAKEIHDAWVNWQATGDVSRGPHGVEIMDVIATIAGGFLAAIHTLI